MCPRPSGRRRNRSIRTRTWPTTGRALTRRSGSPEDLRELVRRRDLELIVAAVARRLVEPPAREGGGVAEAITLHVVVLHLAHPLEPQRLPRQILASAPAALSAGHPRRTVTLSFGPGAPGMLV